MKEILKLEKKRQKTLPMNKKHNTLEKMRSWGGGCRDQNKQGSFCLFWNKKITKQTNKEQNKTKQKQLGKRKGAEKERGGLLE